MHNQDLVIATFCSRDTPAIARDNKAVAIKAKAKRYAVSFNSFCDGLSDGVLSLVRRRSSDRAETSSISNQCDSGLLATLWNASFVAVLPPVLCNLW